MFQAFTDDFPDPDVLYHADTATYHAWGTGGGGLNIRHRTSSNLTTWAAADEAVTTLPYWTEPGYAWAPEVWECDGQYLLYFATRNNLLIDHGHGIACGAAATLAGPFAVPTTPMVAAPQWNGVIDPSPFEDVDGSRYILFKGLSGASVSTIYIQQLRCHGTATRGEAVPLITASETWESGVVEGPSLVHHDNQYILFYSGNVFDEPGGGYGVGYATSPSLLGAYTKKTTGTTRWLQSTASFSGPGGQQIFTDANGQTRMAFHAFPPGQIGGGYNRSMWIGSLNLDTITLT